MKILFWIFSKTKNIYDNFLTKKRAENNGEVPQYYVENSHPAIIDQVLGKRSSLKCKGAEIMQRSMAWIRLTMQLIDNEWKRQYNTVNNIVDIVVNKE